MEAMVQSLKKKKKKSPYHIKILYQAKTAYKGKHFWNTQSLKIYL